MVRALKGNHCGPEETETALSQPQPVIYHGLVIYQKPVIYHRLTEDCRPETWRRPQQDGSHYVTTQTDTTKKSGETEPQWGNT